MFSGNLIGLNILSRCGKESNLSIGILYLSLHEIQYRKLINVLYFFSMNSKLTH